MKKVLSFLLSVLMLLSITQPLTALAGTVTGKCGFSVTYKYNSSTATLTIEGQGSMYDCNSSGQEELSLFDDFNIENVRHLVIKESVSYIGKGAFFGFSGLKDAALPSTVSSMGAQCFKSCSSLTAIEIPDSVTTIPNMAFAYCESLSKVKMPAKLERIEEGAFNTYSDSYRHMTIQYNGKKVEWQSLPKGKNNELLQYSNVDCTDGNIYWYDTSGVITANMYCTQLVEMQISPRNSPSQNDDPNLTEKSNTTMVRFPIKIEGIPVKIDSSWFYNDSKSYNHSMSRLCSQLLTEGYDKSFVPLRMTLKQLGFEFESDTLHVDLDTGRDEMNYFIASKTISKYDEPYNLIVVGCIGSHKTQWNSNFDPMGEESGPSSFNRNPTYHVGFNDAKNYINKKLVEYRNKKGFKKANTKILLTGHSRGAATANLLAAKLINDSAIVAPQNLFTYTFATPNDANKKKANLTADKYKRIFNIVFPNDFVTEVLPTAWGFGKYGTTYRLPTSTNDSKYSTYKSKMMSKYKIINEAISGTTEFQDYANGENDVFGIISIMTQNAKTLQDFKTEYPFGPTKTGKTPYWFFKNVLCPFVNESGEDAKGIANAARAMTGPDGLYKAVTTFFLANGTALSPGFKDAHKMETYCSFMLGLDKETVMQERKPYSVNVKAPVFSKVVGGNRSLTVKWNKVSGVNGYKLQYSEYSDFRKISTVKCEGIDSTGVVAKGIKANKKYYVRVCAYKKIGTKIYYYVYHSPWSKVKSAITK